MEYSTPLNETITPYRAETSGIIIEVAPLFMPEHSDEKESSFVYFYGVKMTNTRDEEVQLLERHWIIRDGKACERVVYGEGVVGQTPYLKSGESFKYHSYCPLKTPTGSMRGYYIFASESLGEFRVEVPVFFLRPQDRASCGREELYNSRALNSGFNSDQSQTL